MDKLFLSYEHLYELVADISGPIKQEFDPEIIVAIGGSGYILARMLREHIDTPIVGVGIKLYGKNDKVNPGGVKRFRWVDENALSAIKGKRVLIVGEDDDTRTTLYYCHEHLKDVAKSIGVLVFRDMYSEYPESSFNKDIINHLNEVIAVANKRCDQSMDTFESDPPKSPPTQYDSK